jgi:hypothetical protein
MAYADIVPEEPLLERPFSPFTKFTSAHPFSVALAWNFLNPEKSKAVATLHRQTTLLLLLGLPSLLHRQSSAGLVEDCIEEVAWRKFLAR